MLFFHATIFIYLVAIVKISKKLRLRCTNSSRYCELLLLSNSLLISWEIASALEPSHNDIKFKFMKISLRTN